MLNGILFVLRSGYQWRMLPNDCPPRSTVQRYFYRWRDERLWKRINHFLRKRKPTPTFRRGFELSRLRVVVGEAVGDGWERGLL